MRLYWCLLLPLLACSANEVVPFVVDFEASNSVRDYQVRAWVGGSNLCQTLLQSPNVATVLGALPGGSDIGMDWNGLEVEPEQSVAIEIRELEQCEAWWGCTVWNGGELRIVVSSLSRRDLPQGMCEAGGDAGTDMGVDGDVGLNIPDGGVDADHGIIVDLGRPDTSDAGIRDVGSVDTGPLVDCRSPTMIAVSTGREFTCALTDDQRAFCWGINDLRQSYQFILSDADVPPTHVFPVGDGADTLVSGDDHTCAEASRFIHCWGSNGAMGERRLGDEDIDNTGPFLAVNDATNLSAGLAHTCGIENSGEVWCWGKNQSGELGRSSMGSIDRAPNHPPGPTSPAIRLPHVTAGVGTSCAWSESAGSLQCWGYNGQSALGFDDTINHGVELLTLLVGGTEATSLEAFGSTHTGFVEHCPGALAAQEFIGNSCAIADGHLLCWGSNPCGGVGNGSTVRQRIPVDVSTEALTPTGAHSWQLAVGGGTTCVTRLASEAATNHELFCWGDGSRGQLLGDARRTMAGGPSLLPGYDVRDVDVGGGHVCVIANEHVYCWGENRHGQAHPLGPPTVTTPHCVEITE